MFAPEGTAGVKQMLPAAGVGAAAPAAPNDGPLGTGAGVACRLAPAGASMVMISGLGKAQLQFADDPRWKLRWRIPSWDGHQARKDEEMAIRLYTHHHYLWRKAKRPYELH